MGPYAKPMEGQEVLSFLFGGGRKKLRVVLICIFGRDFLSPRTAIVSGIETIPAPACLVALMIWHCCYRAKIFEVCGPRIYQSENKFLPLPAWGGQLGGWGGHE